MRQVGRDYFETLMQTQRVKHEKGQRAKFSCHKHDVRLEGERLQGPRSAPLHYSNTKLLNVLTLEEMLPHWS